MAQPDPKVSRGHLSGEVLDERPVIDATERDCEHPAAEQAQEVGEHVERLHPELGAAELDADLLDGGDLGLAEDLHLHGPDQVRVPDLGHAGHFGEGFGVFERTFLHFGRQVKAYHDLDEAKDQG